MPSNIPATTIRIDPEVKREATAILDELGLSMSTAVNATGCVDRSGLRHRRAAPFAAPPRGGLYL